MTETKSSAQTEEDALKAESAPEPGTFQRNAAIHSGSDELPLAIVTSALESAGYAYIYDTLTYERSVVNRNMLRSALKKVRPDGSHFFTTYKPAEGPKRGSLKCFLHAEQPQRDEYARMGFPACPKHNLSTEYDQRQHMRAKHRREWAAIEESRKLVLETEQMQLQREVLKALRDR